jgi:hypothetical protein
MRRAESDRWGRVLLICVAAYVLYVAMALAAMSFDSGTSRIPWAIFCVGLAGILILAGFGMHRATRTARWWLGLILLLPLGFVLAVNAAVFVGLGPVQFEGSTFAYFRSDRPNNMNAVSDAQYVADLYVETQDSGSMFDVQDKSAWIRVENAKGVRLLDEKLRLHSGMLSASANWPTFATLQVTLWEGESVYDKGFNAEYVAALEAAGAKQIAKLTYAFDPADGTFHRVGLTVLKASAFAATQ